MVMRMRTPQGHHAGIVAVVVMTHWHVGGDAGRRQHTTQAHTEDTVTHTRAHAHTHTHRERERETDVRHPHRHT